MANKKFINECKNGANSNRLGKINVETIKKVRGNKLELSNTLDKKLSPRLYGYTKQGVYSGKQLYDVNDYNGSQYGLKDDKDWITLSYDNTNGTANKYINWMTLPSDKLKPNTQYAVVVEVKEVTGNAYVNICGTQANAPAQFTQTYTLYFENTTPGVYKKILTTVSEDITPVSMLRTFATFIPGASGSITFRISVLEDVDTSIVNFNYEPFTGLRLSPSVDYPQEIEVATGNISVKSKSINLYPNSDLISNKTISAWQGVYFNLKEMITKNNLKIGDKVTCSIFFKTNFVPNKALSFSAYRFTEASSNYNVIIPLDEITVGEWKRLSFEFVINEFTLTAERGRFEANYYVSDDPYYFGNNRENAIWFERPQFEVGSLTDYQASNESSVTYDLGDNFLADKDYIEEGKLNKYINKVILNGDENWTLYSQTAEGISFMLNLPDATVGFHTSRCNKYANISQAWNSTHKNDYLIYSDHSSNKYKYFRAPNENITTVEQWKAWLIENPITMYYETSSPKQIELETTGELKTFESNTIVNCDSETEIEFEYSTWDTQITNKDNLTNVSIEDSCYVDGTIIGTTYAKKATSQLIAIPNDVDLLDKKIKVEIGVKYGDLSNEMIKMGNYTIERPKDEQTENLTYITAYDDLELLDNVYSCNLDFSKDITIGDFYIDVCEQLGLNPIKTTFLNSDINITANPFVNKETLRVVLQEIEKVSCTFCELDYETNKIDLIWLSENEEPDYEFKTSDYTTLEGGKNVYGPVNCLVIKESQIEGENTTRQDAESIKTNGETQIAIQDSCFLFTQELREQAIDNIWNRVKGLTYVECKLITSYGKPFLKVGKKIRVNVNDGRVFDTYVLKHTFKYDGAFESTIESPLLTKQETKLKSKSISESIRLTEIRVNKAEGNIKATTKKVDSIDTTVNNNYQDLISRFGEYPLNNKVIEIENSVEQLQTDTYTKTEINTKLTDGSVTKVMTTSGTFDENGMHYEKTGAPTKSTINESGVNVESSTTGEELLFAGYDKELEQTIVRTENLTVRNYLVIGKNSRIEDYEDENGNAGGGIFIL